MQMDVRKAVSDLIELGYSQHEIARLITERGVPVSQTTINRVVHNRTRVSFDTGSAILVLYNDIKARKRAAAKAKKTRRRKAREKARAAA